HFPFYLYHGIKEATIRFKLMTTAIKTRQVANAFFMGGKGLGELSSVVSDLIRPFAGVATLAGFAHIPAIGLVFSFIVPIILIVLNSIGGVTKGWSLIRAVKTLQELKDKRKKLDGALNGVADLLKDLLGPTAPEKEADRDKYELEMKVFKDNHN